MKYSLILVLAFFSAAFPGAARRYSVPLGDVEFNNLSVGVNEFTVNNYTGSNFFPAANTATFENVVLTATESNGTSLTFDLGDIAPGSSASAIVADGLLFTRLEFSAILATSGLAETDESSDRSGEGRKLSIVLVPSTGPYLIAGLDLRTIKRRHDDDLGAHHEEGDDPSPLRTSSTVVLTSATAPAEGQAGMNINVTGSGFPSGLIPPSNVTVTLQPSGSVGPAATFPARAVTTITGSIRRITFQIPASVAVTTSALYQVSISATTSSGAVFSSQRTSELTIDPPASIVAVSPSTGQPGQQMSVTITGVGTNFLAGVTQANFGAGISVGGAPAGTFGPVTVTSPTTATADLVIADGAVPGGQTVVADGQQASLQNGFTLVGPSFITGLTNVVSLSSFSASANSSTLVGCGSSSDCFSIQQNFFIVTPGSTQYEQNPSSSLAGDFTFWVQNVIVVSSAGGQTYAEQFVNVFLPPGWVTSFPSNVLNLIGYYQGSRVPIASSSNLSLASTLSGGTLTLAASANGIPLSSPSPSFSSFISPTCLVSSVSCVLTDQSYIGLPSQTASNSCSLTPPCLGTPAPPELVLVGPPGGFTNFCSTISCSVTTSGSVTSNIVLNGRYAAEVQERAVQFSGTQTGEGSQGLSWPGLTTTWTAAGSNAFTSGSLYGAEGIWFEPANQSAALFDDFTSDSSGGCNGLNTNLWTINPSASVSILNSLALASSSPPASFVTPQLCFTAADGMQMSGVNGFFQTTGIQSLQPFKPPFTVQVNVKGTQATGNPFEIFLVSQDLSQFLTVSGNLNASNGGYYGIWTTAPNISQLWQLGEQLQPPTLAAPNTHYTINITVNANGMATVSVLQTNGTLAGGASNLQPGTGPFYLVLGQREGLPFNGPGPNVAYWKYVSVVSGP